LNHFTLPIFTRFTRTIFTHFRFSHSPFSHSPSYPQVLEEDHRTGLTVIPISDERGKGVAPLAPGAKKSDSRRARDLSPEDLRDLLFALFERKPRWTLKDLVTETRQPHVSVTSDDVR
jgi:hypothetical protein